MKIRRKNWFINSLGNKYELTDTNSKIFLDGIKGLGLSKTLELVRIGNEAEIKSNTPDLPKITGELLFYDLTNTGKYADYLNFIQFAKHKTDKTPMRFYQQTPNSFESWYIDCEIIVLEKDQIEKDGVLHCPIQIQGLSFWKTANEYDLVVEDVIEGGKIYPYTYEYTYEGNSYAHIDLTNNGTLESGFILEINDTITNAVLSLFQDNEKYGEIRIDGTYDKIIVDTRDKKESIYLESGGVPISNPTSKFDLTGNGTYKTPFPKLKVGSSVLTFAFGGTFTKAVHIKWQDLAISI